PNFSSSANGQVLAYARGTGDSPVDVWSYTAGGTARKLTDLNPQVKDWRLGGDVVDRVYQHPQCVGAACRLARLCGFYAQCAGIPGAGMEVCGGQPQRLGRRGFPRCHGWT